MKAFVIVFAFMLPVVAHDPHTHLTVWVDDLSDSNPYNDIRVMLSGSQTRPSKLYSSAFGRFEFADTDGRRNILKFENKNQSHIFGNLIQILNREYKNPPAVVVRKSRNSFVSRRDLVVTDFYLVVGTSILSKNELLNPVRVVRFLDGQRNDIQRRNSLVVPMLTFVAQLGPRWSCLSSLEYPKIK